MALPPPDIKQRKQPDSVALGYVHDTEVSYSFYHSLTQLLMFDATEHGRVIRGGYLACRYGTGGIVGARNKVARQFVETDADWLFWLDTDMGFAPDTIEKLLEVADPVARPIVGGLCFAQKETHEDGLSGYRCAPRVTIMDWTDVNGVYQFAGRAHYPVNSLVQCTGTGSACLLIHRSVFEKIAKENGPTWYDPIVTDEGPIGEDLSFCARAGASGFPVYVHTGVKTTHHKQLWVAEQDYWSQLVVPPATERVAVLVPVTGRPGNVQPLVDSLRASTAMAEPYFIVDTNDRATRAAVLAARAHEIPLDSSEWERPGTFAEKVNHGFLETKEPWVLLVGDDVRFRPDWLNQAMHVANQYGADVVGTNDLGNPSVMAGDHATHMLIRRSYVLEHGASWDGPGIVCHEGYGHWYVDNEIVAAAKQRGVWQMAIGSLVEHLHPIWKKGTQDEVYQLGQSKAPVDEATWQQRLRKYGRAA